MQVMLEPDCDQVEANLHVAVELGQRLLKRNQALLEEQVATRRALAEKDHAIQELVARLAEAQRSDGSEADQRLTIDRLAHARLDAERQRDVNVDRIVELQRTVDALKKAAANSREKEVIQSLNQRLEHLVTLVQTKDEEIERLTAQRSKLESKVDSLLLKMESMADQEGGKRGHSNSPMLRRKSFAPEDDTDGTKTQEHDDRGERLRRELLQARALKDEAEQELRVERAALETKDLIVNALQQNLTEVKRKLEEQEIEMARIVGKDVSFAQLVKGNMSQIEAPVVVPARQTFAVGNDDAGVIQELIAYKSRYACREGADQEFLMRWNKLVHMLESAKFANVEKDLLARGEKPTAEELRRIADSRLAMVEDEANLLRLSPSLQVLPYAHAVFEHMQSHLAAIKALQRGMIDSKRMSARESSSGGLFGRKK